MANTKIIDRVLKVKDNLKVKANADANQIKAQAAILGGIQSKAWRDYMLQFCTDQNGVTDNSQLARLTHPNNSDGLERNRAYLVANGMCGDFTKAHFEENVKSIDQNLPGDCEPTP
jgi:hypothetical protein